MLNVRQILVSARSRAALRVCLVVAAGAIVAGCGQRGPLYLPTDPAAANRATLPQTLLPGTARTGNGAPAQTPAAPAADSSAPAAGPAR